MAKTLPPSGHKARKRFGQNFLVDDNIINQIVHAVHPQASDRVVEIGPGQGAITGPLLERVPHLQVIELDRDLIPVLLAQFAKYRDFKIHQQDALNFDFTTLTSEAYPRLRVVGNLPYNISTPLIFRLLSLKTHIQDMHFMLQKEVVMRLVAAPSTKNYGRLSIMAQYHCAIESLFDVPPESFEPAPKVNSAIARLQPYATPPFPADNLNNLDKFVKQAFSQRRKTLRNCLKGWVDDAQAERVGLDLTKRAENISVEDYVRFCNALWGEVNIA